MEKKLLIKKEVLHANRQRLLSYLDHRKKLLVADPLIKFFPLLALVLRPED
ncbi:MAG: hypothetical protein HQK53_18630 [Oligoflexia bacterium]|nr:hypothetical protein [Oligoflexia bacterium]